MVFQMVSFSGRVAQLSGHTHDINTRSLRTTETQRPGFHFVGVKPTTLDHQRHHRLVAKSSEGGGGGNLGDDMLDFLYAGKKLRKWYGQEGQVLPRDGSPPPNDSKIEEPEADDLPREQVLVLDADTVAMAEQVLLQLILARAKVKALVRDQQAAQSGFGPYIEVVGGSSSDAALVRKACRGVQAVVLCGDVSPAVLSAMAAAGVPHVVLLSAVGAPPRGGFSLFGGGEMAVLEDAKREELVTRSSIPYYTIVRVGKLTDSEGGVSTLKIDASGGPGGVVAREDAALVLAQAAGRKAAETGSLRVAVGSSGAGQPPEDWQLVFRALSSQLTS